MAYGYGRDSDVLMSPLPAQRYRICGAQRCCVEATSKSLASSNRHESKLPFNCISTQRNWGMLEQQKMKHARSRLLIRSMMVVNAVLANSCQRSSPFFPAKQPQALMRHICNINFLASPIRSLPPSLHKSPSSPL